MTVFLIYIFIALFVSFVSSIVETVLLSCNSSHLETLSKDKNSKTIKMIKALQSEVDKSLSSILIVNTFAHIIAAIGVGAQAQLLFANEWQTIIIIVLTLFVFYALKIIPKTIGVLYLNKLLVPSVYIITFITKVTYPLVWLLILFTNYISKGKKHKINFSREQILAVISKRKKEEFNDSKKSILIENLLKLKTINAKNIMTPKSQVFALNADMKIGEAIENNEIYKHARIPIYNNSINDIIGIVFNQDILKGNVEARDQTVLKNIAVPVHKISENISISSLIDLFVERKKHIFIAYDNYGEISGIVTLKDAIGAIIGVKDFRVKKD